MTDLDLLRRHLDGLGKVLLGYSGGVDSALLGVVASETLGPERFLAVIGRSASYPAEQWRTAMELAQRFRVPVLELDTHELEDPRYLQNTTDRCYFCKSELWTRLAEVARLRASIPSSTAPTRTISGSIAPDSAPAGSGASARRWRSWGGPRRLCGPLRGSWACRPGTLPRRLASRAGSATGWRSPPSACARSRTARRSCGASACGAISGSATWETGPASRWLPTRSRRCAPAGARSSSAFAGLGFASVELDPEGYRRGRLLALAPEASV